MLLHRGVPVSIKPKALDTLVLLIEHRDRVVDKDELMNRLWPDTAVEEANLTQNIFVVRKALGEAPGQQRFIQTLPAVDIASWLTCWSTRGTARRPPRKRAGHPGAAETWTSSAIAWSGALLLGLAVAAAVLIDRSASSSAGPIRAIAVLPFEAFRLIRASATSPKVCRSVIADLASIWGFRVTSRQSVMRFDSSPQPLPQFARTLGVEALIEGSVGRSKERIRLIVKLVDGRTDRHLWTATLPPAGEFWR